MPATSERPIAIAGGGLGGLSAALALARTGWRVAVFEQAAHYGAIGYGIQLGPNVAPVLERLGVRHEVMARSDVPTGIVMVDALTGEEVGRIGTGDAFRARFGHPYVVVHRGDLHEVLIDACRRTEAITLRNGAAVVGCEELGDGVGVHLGGGETFVAAAVVGADGLRSAIRAGIAGDAAPDPIGYVAHRTIVPIERVPEHARRGEVVLWAGPLLHVIHYPLRHGTLFNIVAVFRTPTYGERDDPPAYRRELEATFASTHPTMRTLLELMELDRRWPIADRRPVRQWGRGHAVLLGDAAHPTLQTYAQGAGMAFEDGVALADALAGEGDVPERLKEFVRRRYLRTARVQLESRQWWHTYHLADPIAVEVRRAQFAAMGDEDFFRCLGWLWDGVAATPVRPERAGAASD